MKSAFRERIKHISIGIGLGLVFITIFWLGAGLFMYYKQYQRQAAIDRWQYDFEKPYREDTYGGKTPEETWALFLTALEKRDVELASKYFEVEHRDEKKSFLLEEKNIDNLDLFIKQVSSELKLDTANPSSNLSARYFYNTRDEKTKKIYKNLVVFRQNPLTKVWKISTL